MRCPFCQHRNTRVIDTRVIDEGSRIRRRRICDNPQCASRFTTYEVTELDFPLIIKQSGDREGYNPDKLRNGLLRAIEKRPVSGEDLDHLIRSIEKKLIGCGMREVPSGEIGNWVMEELKQIDQVAYIRFASVYLRFSDIESFRQATDDLSIKQKGK